MVNQTTLTMKIW